MDRPYFPVFVDLTDKKATVAGGGKIALRRVKTLLQFGVKIRVTAPVFREEFEQLCEEINRARAEGGKKSGASLELVERKWSPEDLEEADLAIAATDSREVNRQIWEACRARKIPVNVADDKTLCDFYFPSVVMTEDVVVGINSAGEDPGKTKKVRKTIEHILCSEESSLY